MKFSFIFFLTVVFGTLSSLACSCVHGKLADNFQNSQFVAKVRILKTNPDPKNTDYHDAEIELITLYKGDNLTKIKIISVLNSSCAFLPAENSEWIIFASVWQGMLSFGYCSGSFQIDEKFDPEKYPDAKNNYSNSIALKEQVIQYLSDHKLFNPNPEHLDVNNRELNSIKGYKNKNRFAVFQIDINTDFSVAKVKCLRKFQNRKLNNTVLNSMKTGLSFFRSKKTPLTKATQILVFCYYYRSKSSPSFVSLFDV